MKLQLTARAHVVKNSIVTIVHAHSSNVKQVRHQRTSFKLHYKPLTQQRVKVLLSYGLVIPSQY